MHIKVVLRYLLFLCSALSKCRNQRKSIKKSRRGFPAAFSILFERLVVRCAAETDCVGGCSDVSFRVQFSTEIRT